MNSSHCQCKDDIRSKALSLGACACGFAEAMPVSDEAVRQYEQWIADGHNASMEYCAKYREQRNDPRLLLEGAKTVISCAFNYFNADIDGISDIAKYAWGDDYHWVVKSRLMQLSDYIVAHYGGSYRVCVDTAPIRERYWAVKAGIGFVGVNNQLIVPGYGSYCFLGEVLWTGNIEPDAPCKLSCDGCRRCVEACPGNALGNDGVCAAERCVSYLTIEHRGDFDHAVNLGGNIYGCDVCQSVCPHNREAKATVINEFRPDMELLSLSESDFMAMSSSHFKKLVRKKAMSRVTLTQLMRNIKSKGS